MPKKNPPDPNIPKRKRGRPRKEPTLPNSTEKYAEDLGSLGLTGEEVALRLSVDYDTFRSREELFGAWKRGKERRCDWLRSLQFKTAQRNAIMQIFLGKQKALLNQRDRWDHEVAGPGGGALAMNINVRLIKPGEPDAGTSGGA